MDGKNGVLFLLASDYFTFFFFKSFDCFHISPTVMTGNVLFKGDQHHYAITGFQEVEFWGGGGTAISYLTLELNLRLSL